MPRAKVHEINIDYMVEGQGVPLVMIMGLGGARSSWRFQTAFFKSYFRVLTFDNRGVGKSDKPAGSCTIRTMAEDTLGLMDHLGLEKAHVLGVSMGGMIAQELAINHPERVDKLVLGCTFAKAGTNADTPELNKAMQAFGKSSQDKASQRRLIGAMLSLSFKNTWYNRALVIPLAKIAIRFYSITGIVEQLKAISTHDTVERLRMISAPTLVITGTEDRLVNPASSEILAKLVPKAKLVKIAGGGHTFFMEKHRDFNNEVLQFLQGV